MISNSNLPKLILIFNLLLLQIIHSGTSSHASDVIATGYYTEHVNSQNAPMSATTKAGNIKKVEVVQNRDGKLALTVDYWANPTNNYALNIRWCTYLNEYRHHEMLGDNLDILCSVLDPNWENYSIWFEPALAAKGKQEGLRKSFRGIVTKGSRKNQWVYTIAGNLFKNTAVAGIEISTVYSSDYFNKITTTCRGVYSITCYTYRSNIFDVDEVLIETVIHGSQDS